MHLATTRARRLSPPTQTPTPTPTRALALCSLPSSLGRRRHARAVVAMAAPSPSAGASRPWTCEYVPDAASGGAPEDDDAPVYRAALKRFRAATPAPHFAVFTSDKGGAGGSGGDYWCPDCVTALPAVRRAAEAAGASLLEVGVGPRAAWRGNAAHPFRRAPLSLSGVPTLVRLAEEGGGKSAVAARLGPELEAAGSPEAAEKLAAAFFAAAAS